MKYRGKEELNNLKKQKKDAIAYMLIDAWNMMDAEHEVLVEEFGLMTTQNIELKIARKLTREALLILGADEKEIQEVLDLTDRDMRGE